MVNIYTFFYCLQSFYTVFAFPDGGPPGPKHVAVGGFYNVILFKM